MIPVVTADEMAALEEASERAGVSTATLMDNAGAALADEAVKLATPSSCFLVVSGPGNNGGDGLVAALRLAASGRYVRVFLAGEAARLKGLPARHFAEVSAAGLLATTLDAAQGDVIVDAVFGTGLSRAPSGPAAAAIERIRDLRARGAKVVSADLPSGLPSDGGAPFEPHVEADRTVAFGAAKLGQVIEPGTGACGELVIAPIGLPEAPTSRIELVDEASARSMIPKRAADSHKGTFGHVLVIAGSPGKTGAAALSSIAALRTGSGLVTVATRREALPWIQLHAPELMGVGLGGEGPLGPGDFDELLAAAAKKDAIVIGPGIARGQDTVKLIAELLAKLNLPVLLDADALNAIAGNLEVLSRSLGQVVITPHPGEMARLCGVETKAVQQRRLELSRWLATSQGITVVLKGARTLIAHPDGRVRVNPTGNPGMATGGVGDVLSGIIGSLLGQGLSIEEASIAGVFAHGLAGDLMAKRKGQAGLVASDLFEGLAQVWSRWER
jgi:hydroxyethylthiazole kinase-like uncharacterized protein yjeF